MALPTGTAGVFAPVRLDGLLLAKTDTRTPLFNMLGGVASGSRQFIVGAEYEIGSASQPAISETASMTAPTPSYDQPGQITNVTQMFHKAVAETYRSASDVESLTGLNLAGGQANVKNKLAFSVVNRMAEIRNEIEYTIINGEYNLATTPDEADKTRGLNEAITTNIIDANGEELGPDMLIEMARKLVTLSPYGLDGVVGVLNPEQVVQLNKIVINEGNRISYDDAGGSLMKYRTPFGTLMFMEGGHRYQVNGIAGFYRLGACRNVLQSTPGKGNFFYEPLDKRGAAEHGQIFGQWGLDHAHEWLHGKIVDLATTTSPSTAPKVFITNTEEAPVYTSEVV